MFKKKENNTSRISVIANKKKTKNNFYNSNKKFIEKEISVSKSANSLNNSNNINLNDKVDYNKVKIKNNVKINKSINLDFYESSYNEEDLNKSAIFNKRNRAKKENIFKENFVNNNETLTNKQKTNNVMATFESVSSSELSKEFLGNNDSGFISSIQESTVRNKNINIKDHK